MGFFYELFLLFYLVLYSVKHTFVKAILLNDKTINDMNILESLTKLENSFFNELEKGKWWMCEKKEHTSTITNGKDELEVWTSNGCDFCRLYSNIKNFSFLKDGDYISKNNKKLLYKVATMKDKRYLKSAIKSSVEKKMKLYVDYKNEALNEKQLRSELKEFSK